MDLAKLNKLLGLPEGTTKEDTFKKLSEVKGKEGEDMDLKKLNELLGLPEGTSEADAFAKLAEKVKPAEPKPAPAVPAYTVSDELKQLAEDNPIVKGLLSHMDEQQKTLKEMSSNMVETDISAKLAEFDKSKIVLTPKAKDLVHDFLIDAPVTLHEKFWDIMNLLKSSSGLLVELGERAGTSVRYGKSKDHVTLFMDEASRIASEKKINLAEAMDLVSRENPELYDGYRQNSYSFKE